MGQPARMALPHFFRRGQCTKCLVRNWDGWSLEVSAPQSDLCLQVFFASAKAGDKIGEFDIVTTENLVCKKLEMKDENDQCPSYLGTT